MSRSLIALWVALLAAIVLIVGLAYIWNAQRAQIAQQRIEELLQSQLQPFQRTVSEVLEGYSLSLQRELSGYNPGNLQDCVELTRLPFVDEVVVIDAARQLHFPRDSRLSTDRQSLVDEALQLLREQADSRLATAVPTNRNSVTSGFTTMRAKTYGAPSQDQLIAPTAEVRTEVGQLPVTSSNSARQTFGWTTWYHRRGIVLGFWWEQSMDWRTMIVLPRARWMSDVVARLPALTSTNRDAYGQSDATELPGGLNQLIDVEGSVIYQWGDAPSTTWEDLQTRPPTASLALAEPLEGWRLRIFANDELRQRLAGDSLLLLLLLAVAAMVLVLLLVGAVVTVNVNRELRLAASRVSFVNQVSHELRTPLTNIRMYADLVAQALENNSAEHETLERVAVIQAESQRLSRLIGNVLQFARPAARGQPRCTPAVLDEVVEEVLAAFRPRLQRAGIALELQLRTPESRLLDTDAVEQILVNLIGNAEKYAAAGKYLEISTQPAKSHTKKVPDTLGPSDFTKILSCSGDSQTPFLNGSKDGVIIDVRDHGPGIAAQHAERVFDPFVRLCDRLEAPTGTGIGLTIVRRLALEHGGTCELVPSERGAHFRCYLLCECV